MMRELEQKLLACSYCGAPAEHLRPAETATGAGLKVWSFSETRAIANEVERQRSGLAYAAGFAGLIYLFRYSFATLLFTYLELRGPVGVSLLLLWSLSAPVALVLAFIAGASLDRSPENAGRLPALVGLLVGFYGTFRVTAEFSNLIQAFGSF